MSAHTPGPWRLIPPDEPTPGPIYTGTVAVVAHSPSLYVVLDVGHPRTRVLPEEWEPNARLIAAAPDLFAALKAMLASDAERNAPIAPEHYGSAWRAQRLKLETRERAALEMAKNALEKATP